MNGDQNKDIARLFAKLFIARSDLKAKQFADGAYTPVHTQVTMEDLLNHLGGNVSYGHYLLNSKNECKLFAFDIDLAKKGFVPTSGGVVDDNDQITWTDFVPCDPRAVWRDRSQTLARDYFKYHMRILADQFAFAIQRDFEIQTAVAYSGNKGVHVYGFTGLLPARDVREGAEIILRSVGGFEPMMGKNFYRSLDPAFHNFSIEVFPKQTELEPGGLGNLMRLPLGRNFKSPKDPTMFLDVRANVGCKSFTKRNPIEAMTVPDQWAGYDEARLAGINNPCCPPSIGEGQSRPIITQPALVG